MRQFFLLMLLATLVYSCGFKISKDEHRTKCRVKDSDHGVTSSLFIAAMSNGVIINEADYLNFHFVVVKKIPGDSVYFFVEEFTPRKYFNSYKRKMNVYLFSDPTKQILTVDDSALASNYSAFPLPQIFSFLNQTACPKNIKPAVSKTPDTSKTDTSNKPKAGDSLNSVNKVIDSFQFYHSCEKADFLVSIKQTKNGDSIIIANDSIPKIPNDSFAVFYSDIRNFDAPNLASMLKRYYSNVKKIILSDDCTDYLVYKIQEELKWQDSAFLQCTICKASAATKTTTATPAPRTSSPVKAGTVRILQTEATKMQAVYSSSTQRKPQMIPLELQLSGAYNDTANQVSFQLLDTSALSNSFKIYDTTITISEDNWNAAIANGGIYDIDLPVSTTAIKDTLSDDQRDYIVIKGTPTEDLGSHELKLNAFNPNKPFWVEVGANFDMTNGLQTNNLYGGVFMYKKDIFKSNPNKEPNISLFGGIYESKTAGSNVVSDSGLVYRDGSSYIFDSLSPTRSGYPINRDTGIVSMGTTVYSLGLFFSPQIRLTNGAAESNGLHLFLSFWAEMLWQKTQQSFDYSKSGMLPTPDSLAPNITAVNTFPAKNLSTIISDYRSHYLGIGFPVYLKEKDAFFYLNPVFGLTTQRFILLNSSTENGDNNAIETHPKHGWNPFYLLQFRLSDEKYGISVTGEVRGIIYPNSKPSISLALSKKFDLSELAKFVVAPF